VSSKGTDQDLRVSRVAKAIRDIIATAVVRGLRDVPRGPVTVTRVDVTRDFKAAKVYVSIFINDSATEREEDETISRILHAFRNSSRELVTLVNKQLRLKHVPVFEFVHDTGLEKMARMTDILDGIRPPTARKSVDTGVDMASSDDDDDVKGDDRGDA
jgi:ribosome-binding factor A